MRLVSFTESIEACIADLLHAAPYLFWSKGMTITKDMLILTSAIDEDGLFIKVKTVVVRGGDVTVC